MKIAVISDVHSNYHSLCAVMDDLARQKPDFIIGAGDMVGCSAYAGTAWVWQMLHEMEIPFVLGNEEERILKFYDPACDPYLKNSIQFKPLQYRVEQFTPSDIEIMRDLPLYTILDGPYNQNIYVCHASPNHLYKSPMLGIDSLMEKELMAIDAKVVVVGHYHNVWHQYWRDKLIIMAGSGGLPLRGQLDEVDYLILTFEHGEWRFQYKAVKYDYQAAIRSALDSGFLDQSGPIGWLMFDEILTQEDHLTPFLRDFQPEKRVDDWEYWQGLVIEYLELIQRWEIVKPYVQHLL